MVMLSPQSHTALKYQVTTQTVWEYKIHSINTTCVQPSFDHPPCKNESSALQNRKSSS